MKQNKISLLPYIREDIYGMSPNTPCVRGWEITSFNIPDYWKQSRGEDVKIAVIDTGVDFNHEDLKDNILTGKNFVEPNQEPMDVAGHGTHVSSTIAASDNYYGIVGVANKAKILPVKALGNDGSGNINNITNAVLWAADANVDFITMSLGSPHSNTQLKSAIDYAEKKGVIIFCAAGNSGPSVDIMYPARYDNVISIGAIDRYLNRTDFTCSGDSLDFLAPGHEIIGCVPGDKYAIMSGTSMSNPFAVGLAALLCSYNKREKRYKLNNYQDYINIFKQTTKNLNDPKYQRNPKYEGYGIIQPTL
jgi:major intracellular serine protease